MEGILVLLLAIAYFYFCRRVYRKVCRKTEKTWIRAVTVFLLIFLGFGDNIIGNAVFYYLVWKKGGERIYQKVENVQGFMLETDYGGTINSFMDGLFSGKYGFIEQHVTAGNFVQGKFAEPWPYAREKGYYRFYISKPGDNNCNDYFAKYSKYKKKPPYPADICMAYEKISSPISRYSVAFDERKVVSETWFHINLSSTTIKKMHTGEIIAESNVIYYAGGWISHAIFDYRQSKTYPEDTKKIFRNTDFVYQALRPVSK